MKSRRNVLLFLLLFILASCFDRNHERREIVKTWRIYRTAFANSIGTECSKYIDSASIRYYDHMLILVRSADSITVDRLKMDQKLQVLLARHMLSPAEIMRMNGKELFESLVQQDDGGGLKETPNFEFTTINPKHAEARIIDSNGKRGLAVEFNKEYGIWKIDLPSISAQLGKSDWTEVIKETGKTEHEFLYAILELSNNVKPKNTVWNPIVK